MSKINRIYQSELNYISYQQLMDNRYLDADYQYKIWCAEKNEKNITKK